eukprot:1766594-Prymnesium_polylepis.1
MWVAGRRYAVRLRAENIFDWGAATRTLRTQLPRLETTPAAPQPPVALPAPVGRCDAILLRLPPPRRG